MKVTFSKKQKVIFCLFLFFTLVCGLAYLIFASQTKNLIGQKHRYSYRNELERIVQKKVPTKEEIEKFLISEQGQVKLSKTDQINLVKEKFGKSASKMFLYDDLLSHDLTKNEENALVRQIITDYALTDKYWIGLTDVLVKNPYGRQKDVQTKSIPLFMQNSLVSKEKGYVSDQNNYYFGYPVIMPYLTKQTKQANKIALVIFVYCDKAQSIKDLLVYARQLKVRIENQASEIKILEKTTGKDLFAKQLEKFGPLVFASQYAFADMPLDKQTDIAPGAIVPIAFELDFADVYKKIENKMQAKQITLEINGRKFHMQDVQNEELILTKTAYEKQTDK